MRAPSANHHFANPKTTCMGVRVTLSAVVQANSAKRCVGLELLASIVARCAVY